MFESFIVIENKQHVVERFQISKSYRLNSLSDAESSLCDFFLQNLEDILNVEEEIVLTRTSFFGRH